MIFQSNKKHLSNYIITAGILVIMVSTFLPWYRWQVDASPLTQKLGQLDPAMIAKLAPGMTSTADVLSTYGGISSDALGDSVNLWGLWRLPSLVFVVTILVIVITAAITGILISLWGEEGKGAGKDGRDFFRKMPILIMSLATGLSLAVIWPNLDRAAAAWQTRHPAPDETMAAWRQEAISHGYYSIADDPTYGYWVAAAGAVILILGAVIKTVGKDQVIGVRRRRLSSGSDNKSQPGCDGQRPVSEGSS